MKINLLETHDRLLHFKKDQAQNIFKGCEDCLKKNPDSVFFQSRSHYVYIFAHPRTHDDGVTKVMYWQPRLGKPRAQTNSYLFRAISNTDMIEVCWLLPPEELWQQYKMGNVTENQDVLWSIDQYINHKSKLEAPDPDDLPLEKQKQIWEELVANKRMDKMMSKLYTTPETSAESSSSS